MSITDWHLPVNGFHKRQRGFVDCLDECCLLGAWFSVSAAVSITDNCDASLHCCPVVKTKADSAPAVDAPRTTYTCLTTNHPFCMTAISCDADELKQDYLLLSIVWCLLHKESIRFKLFVLCKRMPCSNQIYRLTYSYSGS